MKKKILMALALIAIMTVFFVISISAAEPVEIWDISATEEDNVTAYLYNNPENDGKYTITISGTGNMEDWGNYSDVPWYSSYRSQIASVIIDDGVTSIGDWAFYYCYSLTSVSVGDSVTSIGSYAFQYCESLAGVVIPNGVISIGTSAFSNCASLASITIPNSVTSIGSYAFEGCARLTSMVIPNSVISIGDYAFQYCESLTSVVIPDSVTNIGGWTFYNCKSLTIYCEAQSEPTGWDGYWNYSNRPVVWGYSIADAYLEEIFTFKGYSFGPAGTIAFGFEIDYEVLAKYEEKTGKTLEIGVVFAGYGNLNGNQPLDENGEAIKLDKGLVIKANLSNYTYSSYDFMLSDIFDSISDIKLVIAAYMYDGEVVKYVQENGLSDTVSGISYNEARESVVE